MTRIVTAALRLSKQVQYSSDNKAHLRIYSNDKK